MSYTTSATLAVPAVLANNAGWKPLCSNATGRVMANRGLVEGIQVGCYNRGCSKRSRILDCPRLPAIPASQA
jgi:hypothetical protein